MNNFVEIKQISSTFEMLLQAALFSGETAENAFANWRKTVDFDSLDPISYYLMPTLYVNQRNNPDKDAILNKSKGIYRRTWLENQVRIPHLQAVFRLFDENKIDFIVLSKTPFVWNLFNDKGIFSLDGFDLLIRNEQILAADKLLQKNNWQTNQNIETANFDNSFFYENKDSVQIILRRTRNDNYKPIWETAIKTGFCGMKIKCLSLNEQILYLCDAVFENDKNELWAYYFYLIFSTERAEIDWKNLVVQGKRRKIVSDLFVKLQYLRENFAVNIPAEVLKKLEKAAKAETAPPGKLQTAWTAYRSLRKTYQDNLAEDDFTPKPFGFIKFLREHWQIKSVLSVPWQVGKRFVKNIDKI